MRRPAAPVESGVLDLLGMGVLVNQNKGSRGGEGEAVVVVMLLLHACMIPTIVIECPMKLGRQGTCFSHLTTISERLLVSSFMTSHVCATFFLSSSRPPPFS